MGAVIVTPIELAMSLPEGEYFATTDLKIKKFDDRSLRLRLLRIEGIEAEIVGKRYRYKISKKDKKKLIEKLKNKEEQQKTNKQAKKKRESINKKQTITKNKLSETDKLFNLFMGVK